MYAYLESAIASDATVKSIMFEEFVVIWILGQCARDDIRWFIHGLLVIVSSIALHLALRQ